jgi:hypothetical protein
MTGATMKVQLNAATRLLSAVDPASLATDDFQRRDGRYPASGKPDTINHYKHNGKDYLEFSFKNTSVLKARAWVRDYINGKGFQKMQLTDRQDGDYDDDWVVVIAS